MSKAPITTEADETALRNAVANLERQLKKANADNEKLRRDLGNSRARAKKLRESNGSLERLLKEGGPEVVANEDGEVIVTLKDAAAVGEHQHPAHTVIARVTPCAGATLPYILDAVRSGKARATPAKQAEAEGETEKYTGGGRGDGSNGAAGSGD